MRGLKHAPHTEECLWSSKIHNTGFICCRRKVPLALRGRYQITGRFWAGPIQLPIVDCRLPIEKILNETIKAEFENELQGREKDKQNRQ
jgi:hypothetical protein